MPPFIHKHLFQEDMVNHMDVTFESCPYCGGIVSSENQNFRCTQCCKRILVDRADKFSFIEDGPRRDSMKDALSIAEEGRCEEALKRVNEMIEETPEDQDVYFLRGTILALMGEEGKAFTDWKKGISIIDDINNIDAYVCLICSTVADMIYQKESDFVEFDYIRYIDRVSQLFSDVANGTIKAFIFYTVYVDFVNILTSIDGEKARQLFYVLPSLFRNVIVYHTNYTCLSRVINEYLFFIGYNEDTYDDDDMIQCHLYHMVGESIAEKIGKISPECLKEIGRYWNDERMSVLDNDFSTLESIAHGRTKKKDITLEEAVDEYTDKCLMINNCDESE